MKIPFGRFIPFLLLCASALVVLTLPAFSQGAKPDEDSNKSTLRAGVNGVGTPTCVYCPNPDYSEKARAAKLEGSVLMEVTVTAEGKATNITVLKGLGDGLEEKAIEALKSWKFKPATDKTGKPVAVRTTVHVTFRLLN